MATNYPESAPGEQRAHVLLVEDNISQRIALAEALRLENYVVYEAATADEGSLLLASPLMTIHLVIIDLWLPGNMSGFDFVEYIRYTFPELPVIITSGVYKAMPEDKHTVFLQKPYTLEAISIQISQLLQSTKEGKE